MEAQTFRFGELEAILADLNDIPSHNRTAFQARLKNFHRLGFPAGIGQGRGKAVVYTAHELILMAIAVEMTQLGLTPERSIQVITEDEFPLWMSVMMASRAIEARPEGFRPAWADEAKTEPTLEGFNSEWADSEDTDPESFFLYFDPSVLAPRDDKGADIASATFFFAGAGNVRENLSRWTTGPSRRISLINVTSLLWNIAAYINGTDGIALVKQFEAVASAWIYRGDFDLDRWLVTIAKTLGMMVAAQPDWLKDSGPKWMQLRDLIGPENESFGHYIILPEQMRVEGLPDRAAPDMIIRLPGQRELMVDAKIYQTADIPQQGIEARLEELAEKPYRHQFADKTEYIVLYIPSEHFFAGAVSADKTIVDRALAQKVIITTPAIFLNLLAEVDTAWDKYREEFPDLGEEEYATLVEQREARTNGDD